MAGDALAAIASLARQRLALTFGFCPHCFLPMMRNIRLRPPPSETAMMQVVRVDGRARSDCDVVIIRTPLRQAS